MTKSFKLKALEKAFKPVGKEGELTNKEIYVSTAVSAVAIGLSFVDIYKLAESGNEEEDNKLKKELVTIGVGATALTYIVSKVGQKLLNAEIAKNK